MSLSLRRCVSAWDLGTWNTFLLLFRYFFCYFSATFLVLFHYFSATVPLLFFLILFRYISTTFPILFRYFSFTFPLTFLDFYSIFPLLFCFFSVLFLYYCLSSGHLKKKIKKKNLASCGKVCYQRGLICLVYRLRNPPISVGPCVPINKAMLLLL